MEEFDCNYAGENPGPRIPGQIVTPQEVVTGHTIPGILCLHKNLTGITPSSFKVSLNTTYKHCQMWIDIYTEEYEILRDMQTCKSISFQ